MISIDKEFKNIIPPLTTEEYSGLEIDIIKNGCRVAIDIWNDIIIDGHNRYDICTKHNIKFQTKNIQFPDRTMAMLWIIANQLNRRNLQTIDRIDLIRRQEGLKQSIKAKAKERMYSGKKPDPVQISAPGKTRDRLADIAGVSHDTYKKGSIILEKAEPEVIDKIRKGEQSINKAYTDIKRTEAKEKVKSVKPPEGKYRVVYADPPWKYNDKLTEGYGAAEHHYPTMTIEELCLMPVKELLEDSAVLFLWTTSPLLEDSFKIISAWGFKYKTSFIWDKVKHNMGHYNSVRHEFLLVCTKGSCTPDNPKLFDSVQTIERSDVHSEKPEEFRTIIETLYTHGKKIELFARKQMKNWTSYGNQC